MLLQRFNADSTTACRHRLRGLSIYLFVSFSIFFLKPLGNIPTEGIKKIIIIYLKSLNNVNNRLFANGFSVMSMLDEEEIAFDCGQKFAGALL